MPLETVLGVPAPPRHFAKPLNRWLFLLASRFSVLSLGIIAGILLAAPYIYYVYVEREDFMQRLREEPVQVKYLSEQLVRKNTEKGTQIYTVYEYEIEFVPRTGGLLREKISSQKRLGCLREYTGDSDERKIGCVSVDKLLYSGAPEHLFFTEKPKASAVGSLYLLVPAFCISLLIVVLGVKKQRLKLPLLLTGMVAEGSLTEENITTTDRKGNKIKKMLYRYEFKAFDGKTYQGEARVHNSNIKKVPILYDLSDPNDSMICHSITKDFYMPRINSDASIGGFGEENWLFFLGIIVGIFLLSVSLTQSWGALPK